METPTDNELSVDRQEPLEGSPADKAQEPASTSTDESSQAHQSTAKHDTQGRARQRRSSYKPPSLKRLVAGMGASIATGVVLGKLVRGPWSDQVDTFDDRLLDATREAESKALDPVMGFFSNIGEPQA